MRYYKIHTGFRVRSAYLSHFSLKFACEKDVYEGAIRTIL